MKIKLKKIHITNKEKENKVNLIVNDVEIEATFELYLRAHNWRKRTIQYRRFSIWP